MTITERTLKRWRKEALVLVSHKDSAIAQMSDNQSIQQTYEQAERILRLTQELLDQHLMRKP